MDASTRGPARAGAWLLVALVGLAAAGYQGYHLAIAFQPDDTNHLETPLALSTARQFIEGPEVLYGPYTARRPLVLVHAPLYYRLTALVAAPRVHYGRDPVEASLYAGRLLSAMAFWLALVYVYEIATIDGAGLAAGLLSALLVAASAVFGSTPFTVRPDTLGVALQTAGAALVLRLLYSPPALAGCSVSTALSPPDPDHDPEPAPRALDPGREPVARTGHTPTSLGRQPEPAPDSAAPCVRPWSTLLCAYLAFALAACTKQHDLVAMAVSSLLLAGAWWRGRLRLAPIVVAHILAAAVLAAYYGFEQHLTGGRMFESVFRLPAAFRTVAPAGWDHVGLVFIEVAKRSAGLLALTAVVGLGVALRLVPLRRLDAALALYLVAELAATAILCKGSEGAWVNYAMQAVLWAAILTGRGLGRLAEPAADRRALRLAGLGLALVAALGLIVADARLVLVSYRNRQDDRRAVAELLADPEIARAAPRSLYFVGAPDHNRLYGRRNLAHDEWLYTAFESVGAAELRRDWLERALRSRVRFVVEPFDARYASGWVPGLAHTLPGLGYRLRDHYARFLVWERPEADPSRRRPGP